jgi:hypothetical protein
MGGLLTNGLNQIEERKKEKKEVKQANGLGWMDVVWLKGRAARKGKERQREEGGNSS